MNEIWTEEEIAKLSKKFGISPDCRLHPAAEDYHFPRRSFLRDGYSTPGGYVKDFSLIRHEGRFHLFHIDGRPGESCTVTGNEISFGHASTTDLCHWIRHPMPLAVGERPWESEHVWAPYVHRHQGLFYMFYMGKGQGHAFISYATSPDLERWVRWKDGPITCAVGRDPFIRVEGDQTILIYTNRAGPHVSACASDDLKTWEPLPHILTIPEGKAIESPSLHPLKDGFVLWFNDFGETWSPCRAAYAISRDPYHFEPDSIRTFDFRTDDSSAIPSPECCSPKPFPLSIERLASTTGKWLVSYFRWHGDRNRLFFGEIDWSAEPAVLREIRDPGKLQEILISYRLA